MKKINYLIKIILVFAGILFSISTMMNADLYGTLIRLSIIPLALLPNIAKKKIKITEKVEFVYLLFLFVAHFLGSIVNLYYQISWYDTFVHYLSGWVTAFLGYIIYVKGKERSKAFEFLFIISFSALIAISWETFEFVCDQLFQKDAQNVITTGVTDTMIDMIVALLGSITVEVLAFIKNGLLSKFKREIQEVYGKNLE